MGFRSPKALEKGMFLSPALGVDAPYELIEDEFMPNGLAVRCIESKTKHDTETLATPTLADMADQHRAFVREVCAWFVANGRENPVRQHTAVHEIRRLTGADYVFEDLAEDVGWVRDTDLSTRLHVLGKHLDEARRKGLVQLAATIGTAGGELSKSDTQFVELLGAGLKLSPDFVASTVVTAMNAPRQQAA